MTPGYEFFIDPSRCIGCKACMQACTECDTHRGRSMIHLEFVDRATSTQTSPVVCMHCEDPACARVCPADAIKQTEDGIVHSSAKSRCIGCSNCVLACPFGVPHYVAAIDQMLKCDMCFDRTSVGKRPMCATVCPSQALFFGTPEELARLRPERPVQEFHFGDQVVRTKVHMMTATTDSAIEMDVLAWLSGSETESADVASASVWEVDYVSPQR